MIEILQKIKEVRKNKGISQDSIAHFLKIELSTYNKIERNDIKLTLERFLLISKYFEEPIDKLLDIETKSSLHQHNDNQNSTGCTTIQQIEHYYTENKEIYQKLIATLEAEITHLKGEIDFLRVHFK